MTALRVALVCPYDLDRPGGVQAHVRGLARALRQRGHEARVVGPGRMPAGEGEMRMGRFVTVGLSGTRIDLVTASPAELARLRASRFEVVHLHTPWSPFLPLQAWAATPTAAHVATFHDAPPGGPWGALAGHLLMPVAGRLLAPALHGIIAVSEVAARALPRRRAVIVPNGIDLDGYKPAETTGRSPTVASVGRLEPRKGVADLVEAFAGLIDDFPEVTLVIAGDGPLAPALRRRAAGLANVRFIGAVSEREKAALMGACRVFCAPSRHGESFGIVLLEAMASGAPVVAAANPGYRALLGDDGLLYAPGDVTGLREHLARVLRDAPLAATLRQRGLARVAAFDWTRLAETVEDVYLHAVRARRSRA